MEIEIPGQTSLILIQEFDPCRSRGGDKYEYRPPMLVVGEEWYRIDRHQRGIVRANAQDVLEFTGIVPSADHDTMKHVEKGTVRFGKMKWRHLENAETTSFCALHQQRLNELVDKHGVQPGILVTDPEKAKAAGVL